jgi:hypothetical protein
MSLLQNRLRIRVQVLSRVLEKLERVYARLLIRIAQLYRENSTLKGGQPCHELCDHSSICVTTVASERSRDHHES